MEQSSNYKHKISFLLSNSMSASQPEQTTVNKKKLHVFKKCNECKKIRKTLESHQICYVCYKIKTIIKPKQSGNKVIDDFIRYTQNNYVKRYGKMEFVPYEQFNNIEFIAEGGFSKIYRATWIDGPIYWHGINRDDWNVAHHRNTNYTVVLKKLNDSKNITTKELNELKVFYQIYSDKNAFSGDRISHYFGITQDPITKDIMIVMPYYNSGDLIRYLSNDFYNISWKTKLFELNSIIIGLNNIHNAKIIHRDLHSGNIFFKKDTYHTTNYTTVYIGDLGISKSATESTESTENYGIIPYMAPEIFQGQKYTKASDIYSFGMIMWEFMTGRRPFWDEIHDIELIIKICDGLRPPIVTNASEGYIELMKECWHSDPDKRPPTTVLRERIWKMRNNEEKNSDNNNPTKIIKTSEIGPITINNPGAIYKSRPLSCMIQSAMSLRSSRNRSIDPFYCYQKKNEASTEKRKIEDDPVNDSKGNDDQNIKRRKFLEDKNNDYITKEIELDINMSSNINMNSNEPTNNGYVTREFDLDIGTL